MGGEGENELVRSLYMNECIYGSTTELKREVVYSV